MNHALGRMKPQKVLQCPICGDINSFYFWIGVHEIECRTCAYHEMISESLFNALRDIQVTGKKGTAESVN